MSVLPSQWPVEVREDVQKSGLSDATVQQARLFVPRPQDLPGHFTTLRTSLCLPYFDIDGQPTDFYRLKLFPPQGDPTRPGKHTKYFQPLGSGLHTYLPPLVEWRRISADVSTPIYFTEGEKKTLAACQRGLVCLGLGGVWNGILAGELLADVAGFQLRGRPVILVPDSDCWHESKHQALLGLIVLGVALAEQGAVVSFLVLPDLPGVGKTGLDDYLVQCLPSDPTPLVHLTVRPLEDPTLSTLRKKAVAKLARDRAVASSAQPTPASMRTLHLREMVDATLIHPDGSSLFLREDTRELVWKNAHGFLRSVQDDELIQLTTHFMDTRGASPPLTRLREAAIVVARTRPLVLPGREAVRALPPWDGVPRVKTFFRDWWGVPLDPYTEGTALYMWTAMAGRSLEPGIQADAIVVLVGPQGLGKSFCIQSLALARDWFTELDLGQTDQELRRALTGVQVAELSELSGLTKRTSEEVKSLITRRADSVRMAYGRTTQLNPRWAMIFGTTNDPFFSTEGIGWRRILPVVVAEPFDPAHTYSLVNGQLWAEAAGLFEAGGVRWQVPEHEAHSRVVMGLDDRKETVLEVAEDLWAQWGSGSLIRFRDILDDIRMKGVKDKPGTRTTILRELNAEGWTFGHVLHSVAHEDKRVDGFYRMEERKMWFNSSENADGTGNTTE